MLCPMLSPVECSEKQTTFPRVAGRYGPASQIVQENHGSNGELRSLSLPDPSASPVRGVQYGLMVSYNPPAATVQEVHSAEIAIWVHVNLFPMCAAVQCPEDRTLRSDSPADIVIDEMEIFDMPNALKPKSPISRAVGCVDNHATRGLAANAAREPTHLGIDENKILICGPKVSRRTVARWHPFELPSNNWLSRDTIRV